MIQIFIKVKPKARAEKVEKIDASHYIVHTTHIPEKGKANAGVIELLADYFSVPKSHVALISGKTARLKIFAINL